MSELSLKFEQFLAYKQPPEVFSEKKVFFEILQYSLENACVGVSF